MSETTKIEWAHHTASPWFGCTQVDPCCANCYAMELTLRYGWAGWGDNSPRVRSKGFWTNVYKWNEAAEAYGVRNRIFTSLMDWLDEKAPIQWLADFLQVIYDTPNLDWLLLTKRPENFWRVREALSSMKECPAAFETWVLQWFDGYPPDNVWFGYTAGTRKTWRERAVIAANIPANIKWCSAEPLLEPLHNEMFPSMLDWIVIGGESGANRRMQTCHTAIEQLARQAKQFGRKVFVKQDAGIKPGQQGLISDEVWAMKEFPR